jgi:hypothetical protein
MMRIRDILLVSTNGMSVREIRAKLAAEPFNLRISRTAIYGDLIDLQKEPVGEPIYNEEGRWFSLNCPGVQKRLDDEETHRQGRRVLV